ncbi:MAG: sporulation protein YabP [Defluviitaleaceae bacterium]|nr:sporulation protein YabP [Defluviitaleaceae bacterium]
MADEKRPSGRHTVMLDRRESVSVTGVTDVLSFDEETIIAETEMGILILRGESLHVNRLNLETGDLEIDGGITQLSYEDQALYGKGGKSLLNKLFR